MLKWRSKIEGNAAQARQAARKIVQSEIEQLDPLVAELLEGQKLVAEINRRGGTTAPMLFPRL